MMEQLELKFDKREFLEDKIRREYAEFRKIENVWAAGRFAKRNEPEPDWREHNLFYVPRKGRSWEVKKILARMYPSSKSEIKTMNNRQAYKFYLDILYYISKVKRIIGN